MTAKISAILAAGGRGTRFAGATEGNTPKQFIELRGYPIFVWSLRVLLASPAVANAVIVAPPDMVAEVKQELSRHAGELSGKDVQVVDGGATRQQSVYNGLLALEPLRPDYVVVHDAARPFLTSDILNRFISALLETGACTTGLPLTDTIKRTSGSEIIETLDRQSLALVQTPQGARYEWLRRGHEQAAAAEKATTDDAAVLELAGHRVSIVDGAPYNLKITRPDDLLLAEALAAILFADRL